MISPKNEMCAAVCEIAVAFYHSYQTWALGTQKESTTIPPDPRGDTSGPGVDEVGHSAFKTLIYSVCPTFSVTGLCHRIV